MQSTLKLRHIETFIAIAEKGTLTAAGELLKKTQGAVSHDLNALERAVGLTLVDRGGQSVRLTEAGRVLLPQARDLLQRAYDIEISLNRVRGGGHQIFRVGALPSLAPVVLRAVRTHFEQDPGGSYTLVTNQQRELVDAVLAGDLDCAVTEYRPREGLINTSLGSQEVAVVLRRDDPLAGRESLSARDLAHRRFVSFRRERGSTRLTEFFFGANTPPNVVAEADHIVTVRRLVALGMGVALMPSFFIQEDPTLTAIPTTPPLEREIVLLRSANRWVSPELRTFIDDFLVPAWSAAFLSSNDPDAATE